MEALVVWGHGMQTPFDTYGIIEYNKYFIYTWSPSVARWQHIWLPVCMKYLSFFMFLRLYLRTYILSRFSSYHNLVKDINSKISVSKTYSVNIAVIYGLKRVIFSRGKVNNKYFDCRLKQQFMGLLKLSL